MTRIVINTKHGGFSLSRKALHRLRELGCETAIKETDLGEQYPDTGEIKIKCHGTYCRNIPRDDPHLVAVVDELGREADGFFAVLKIVEIPDDVQWQIEDYDGSEWVAEKHRTWL